MECLSPPLMIKEHKTTDGDILASITTPRIPFGTVLEVVLFERMWVVLK